MPPLWAKGGHRQTILGYLIPSPQLFQSGLLYEVDLADGDRLRGRYYEVESDTIVALFHGLSGSSQSDYMQRIAIECLKHGHSVLLMNHRGAGEGLGCAKKPYHSGVSDDVAAVIAKLRKTHKGKKIGAVGFSMSGNILALLLGQTGKAKPDFAVTVNAPLELGRCAFRLRMGLNKIYDIHFVANLRSELKTKKKLGLFSEEYRVSPFGSVMDFDQKFTAPACGFNDREDYYTQCSSKKWVQKIRVPTVMITSKDDPFVDWEEYVDAKISSSIHFHLENYGGHLGYISRKTPRGNQRWLDYVVMEYIEALREQAGVASIAH